MPGVSGLGVGKIALEDNSRRIQKSEGARPARLYRTDVVQIHDLRVVVVVNERTDIEGETVAAQRDANATRFATGSSSGSPEESCQL